MHAAPEINMGYQTYAFSAWVQADTNQPGGIPALAPMEWCSSGPVTSVYGQGITTTFEAQSYIDFGSGRPPKGITVVPLRPYTDTDMGLGVLVKAFIAFNDLGSGTDPYFDNLLVQWSTDGSIKLLEQLWISGTSTRVDSVILTPAENALWCA